MEVCKVADTIDFKFQTSIPIEDLDLKTLKNLSFINKGSRMEQNLYLTLSFPRGYYHNNAKLIKYEEEVQKVLLSMIEGIESLGYEIEKIELMRVDYPFTYYRDPNENFNSHRQIYELFSLCAEEYGWKAKDIGRGQKETCMLVDTLISGRSRNKITIYNQALRLMETGWNKDIYYKTLMDYPELPNRTRIEVSLRRRKVLKNLKDLKLKEIKELAYGTIEEIIFNQIPKVKDKLIAQLGERLKMERESKGNKFKLESFILREENKRLIIDFTIMREAINIAYKNNSSVSTIARRAKKIIIEMEEKEGVFYISNLERIKKIERQLKKERRNSTLKKS
jgi:hypothetical protein